MADQIGDPLGILHIGLATRHVTDMPGVADDEVETPFQHSIDRAPVNAGALHADLRHPKLLQPVPQRLQIVRHRPEGPDLLPRPLAWGADQDAGDDRLLMHVQPTTPLNDDLHPRLHPGEGDRDAAGIVETLLRVLPVPGGDKEWYLYAARAGLPLGVASHRSFVSLSTIARCKGSNKSARAATIFIDNGAPQALVGCHELDDGGFGVVRHDEFRNPVLRRPARGRAGLAFMLFCAAREGAMAGTRKIAAILVADVVGYSRLAGADEDRTLSRLRGLRSDLIDPAIDAHHGRIVKRTGDGILVEFRSVVDAVRCAIEVQQGLIERNAGLPPERRIEFRVGIHLGDVVEEADGDLMGDGVNIAARLEGIAKPGAICLSEQTYWQVKGRQDLAVADLGPTQLKNIAEPVRVYSLEVGKPALAKRAEPKRRTTLAPLGLGVAALVILVAASAWYFSGANRLPNVASTAAAPAAHLSIVVLPFKNLSGDPSQDYFADGVTDNLTTELSRIRNSFVIAAHTA